jgi:exopolyphosphatase / guanosine-5'-triphosphate,3'-diphosphate pyrophosphatase
MRIAAFDLGTNTFNLLVADATEKTYNEVYREKKAVKLGHGGIVKKIISDKAMERGRVAIRECLDAIAPLNVDKILAVATAAFRTAENGAAFGKKLRKEFGIEVRIIGGDEEAELIYHGIRRAVPLSTENVLMLDIGGGSNEFIIANNNCVAWKQSFPLGIAMLLELFKPSDPMTPTEVKQVNDYLDKELKDFKEALSNFPIKTVVGSSGSFDTLANICSRINNQISFAQGANYYKFSKDNIISVCNKLIYSTHSEREKIPGMDLMRVEMMPLGAIFIQHILQMTNVTEVIQSAYAIKEGIIFSYSEVEN